jgi:hypothetical protein
VPVTPTSASSTPPRAATTVPSGDEGRRAAARSAARADVRQPTSQRPAAHEDVRVRVAQQQQQRQHGQRRPRARFRREGATSTPQVLAPAPLSRLSTTQAGEASGPPCSCSAETMRPSNSGRARSTTRAASRRPGPRNSGRSTRRSSMRAPSTATTTSSAPHTPRGSTSQRSRP